MRTYFLIDDNGYIWILQKCPCGCGRIWADVEGDEVAEECMARGEHSGYIENTVQDALDILEEDGYLGE